MGPQSKAIQPPTYRIPSSRHRRPISRRSLDELGPKRSQAKNHPRLTHPRRPPRPNPSSRTSPPPLNRPTTPNLFKRALNSIQRLNLEIPHARIPGRLPHPVISSPNIPIPIPIPRRLRPKRPPRINQRTHLRRPRPSLVQSQLDEHSRKKSHSPNNLPRQIQP